MPELPDLEVIAAVLAPRVVGRTIRGAKALHPAFLQSTEPPLAEARGRRIAEVGRRGKYLLFHLSGELHLAVHLMRAGWVWHGASRYEATKSTVFRIELDDGNDIRVIEAGFPKLSRGWLLDSLDKEPLAGLGVEPLSEGFTLERFVKLVAGKRRQIKKLLVDQRLIAGIGNAYADEILFVARLSPFRYAHTLDEEELARLWRAIPEVLRWAIAEIRSRVGEGLYQEEERSFLRVHGRAGKPCPECGTPIGEVLLGGQRTDFCPRCQHVDEFPANARRV
ncbi:Fpg/Nei family DNA glycosylase [Candidatus Bipolaricaulota sp. J31]